MNEDYEKYLSEGGERVDLVSPEPRKTAVLSVRVTSETMDRLTRAAREEDLSTGAFARQLIEEGLSKKQYWHSHFRTVSVDKTVVHAMKMAEAGAYGGDDLFRFETGRGREKRQGTNTR